jgi:hypothetical protein
MSELLGQDFPDGECAWSYQSGVKPRAPLSRVTPAFHRRSLIEFKDLRISCATEHQRFRPLPFAGGDGLIAQAPSSGLWPISRSANGSAGLACYIQSIRLLHTLPSAFGWLKPGNWPVAMASNTFCATSRQRSFSGFDCLGCHGLADELAAACCSRPSSDGLVAVTLADASRDKIRAENTGTDLVADKAQILIQRFTQRTQPHAC